MTRAVFLDRDGVLDVNVRGAFLMSKYAMPHLRASHGSIVSIASYTGLVGFAEEHHARCAEESPAVDVHDSGAGQRLL